MFIRGTSMTTASPAPPTSIGPYPVTGTSGTIVRRRDIPGFSITDSIYPEGLSLAKHCHKDAYLSFILTGEYEETYSGAKSVCSQGSLRFLPPAELHENYYISSTRSLLVKIDPTVLSRLCEQA